MMIYLTLSMLSLISTGDMLEYSKFSHKIVCGISKETIDIKCESPFSGKK